MDGCRPFRVTGFPCGLPVSRQAAAGYLALEVMNTSGSLTPMDKLFRNTEAGLASAGNKLALSLTIQ